MANEWLKSLERMDDSELPFKLFQEDSARLETLHLTPASSAGDVRRAAVSLRRKFEEGGLDIDTFGALKWALEKTKDAITSDEFLYFLLHKDVTFGGIETDRFDFR